MFGLAISQLAWSAAIIGAVAGAAFALGIRWQRSRTEDVRAELLDGAEAALCIQQGLCFLRWISDPFEMATMVAKPPTPGEQVLVFIDSSGFARRVSYVGDPVNCWRSSGGN